MSFQESFTAAEWRTLQFAPLWVFRGVAEADEYVDEEEIETFAGEIAEGELYDDPLVKELFGSLVGSSQILPQFKADPRDMSAGLAEVADLLDRKGGRVNALAFKKALLLVARKVAEASGDGDFSSRSVSEEEQVSLLRVADLLGTSLEEE